jgi:hypothetical protein
MARLTSSPTTVVVTNIPAWVPAPGKFANASLDFPAAADPDPNSSAIYRGVQGFAAVWTVWNSGVYAPTVGTYGSMLFFGGANRAYDGNAIIAYDIAARTHRRLSEPALYSSLTEISGDSNTVNANVSVDGGYPNGTPFPCHTYMLPTFLPSDAGGGTLGSWVYMCHIQNNVRILYPNFWRFDLSARTWSRWRSPYLHGVFNLNGMCYDSTRKRLWLIAPGPVNEYGARALWMVNMVNSSETQVMLSGGATSGNTYASTYAASQPGPVYIPERDCLVHVGGGGNHLICTDLSGVAADGSGTAVAHVITQSGTACPSLWNNMGFGLESVGGLEYCSYDGNLWVLNQFNGTAVAQLFKLTPPAGALTGTWTWSSEILTSISGETLALRASTSGTVGDRCLWGRFRYVPPLKSFIWSDAKDLRVQMGRPRAFL